MYKQIFTFGYLLFFGFVSGHCACSGIESTCRGCSLGMTEQKVVVKPQVIFHNPEGRRLVIDVELACTPEEQQRGLMFRKELSEGQGMLFVFPSETIQSFWMKNTFIPLDMIHLDKTGKIVGVIENAKPHDESSHAVGVPAKYVLEVNAFFAKKYFLKAGMTADILGVRPGC